MKNECGDHNASTFLDALKRRVTWRRRRSRDGGGVFPVSCVWCLESFFFEHFDAGD